MPQSSRMMVMFWACFSQALTFFVEEPWGAQATQARAATRMSFFMTPYNSPVMKLSVLPLALVLSFTPPAVTLQPAKVKVGYCTGLSNLEAAKAAGFDYVELPATEIASLSDADFDTAAAKIKQLGIATPVANLFLPSTLKVTGPQTDPEQQMAYVRKAFTRLSKLGTEIVVFGSGGARRVPDGFAKEEAFKQLVDFGRRAATEARLHGITI